MPRQPSSGIHTLRCWWQSHRQLRFLIVGGWNTAFGYGCFFVLYHVLGDRLHYLLIAVAAHAIAVTQSYIVQRRLVFHSNASIPGEFLRFNAGHLGTLGTGLVAMFALVDLIRLSPLVAQAIVTALTVALSYILHSRVTFRHTRRPEA